jgi:hypothetical protein
MAFQKRWLLIMLACILALSLLAACAAEKSGTTPTPEPTPQVAPIPVDEVSLEEAGEILGAPLPTPGYLPLDYELRRVFVREGGPHVYLLFSDEEITGKVQTLQDLYPLMTKVTQPGASGGPRLCLIVEKPSSMPPLNFAELMAEQAEGEGGTVVDMSEVKGCLPANTVSVVEINQVKGYLSTGETSYALEWFWSGFHFDMRMTKELPVEELIKIAESIG